MSLLGIRQGNSKSSSANNFRSSKPAARRRALHIEPLEERAVMSVTLASIVGPETGGGYNVPSGKTLYVPLLGSSPGQTVTYQASSSDPNVQVSVMPSTNPIVSITVHGKDGDGQDFSGTMTFQLFRNIAPQTVQGIIDKATAGLYNGASFYRMETSTGFKLIQGGIEKTPGKTDTQVLPDEFNVDATLNSGGLLVMANAGPNTATSEIFVTAPNQPLEQTPGVLNFGYTVFGQLLTGADVYSKIQSAQTTANSQGIHYANTPITIDSATVVNDSQYAVLQVKTPVGYTGTSGITVTATSSDTSTDSKSFNVTGVTPSTTAQSLVLAPLANQTSQNGQSVNFQVSAQQSAAVPGTAVFTVTSANGFRGALPSGFNVQVTPGAGKNATVSVTPPAGFTGSVDLILHVDVQATANFAIHDAQKFTLTVTAAAHTPTITPASTNQNTQTTSGLVITPHNDDATLSTLFYKVTGITGGTLFLANGTTQVSNGSFITKADGLAGLKFTPTPGSVSNGSFVIQASTSQADGGLGGNQVTATITLSAVAHTPSVTNAITPKDTQTTSGLVISPNTQDVGAPFFYKITGITGGTLFKSDGTTQINNGDFIPFADGAAGLKFTPTAGSTADGSFSIQAATDTANATLGGAVVTATIDVVAVAHTPSVPNASTPKNQQSAAIVITPDPLDTGDLFYKVTGITGGKLFKSDGTSEIVNGAFISKVEGAAGLKFSPTPNSSAAGSFTVQASTTSSDVGLGGSQVTSTITVTAGADVANTPSITTASTSQNTQTPGGLVITASEFDANLTDLWYKVTGITGGTLFKSDGTTQIANGTFITKAEGAAGLKFTPSSLANGSFTIQASTSNADAGLGGQPVVATVTVTPIAHTPGVTNATTTENVQTTSGLVISASAQDDGVTLFYKITEITGGTLFKSGGTTPITNGMFITRAEGAAGLKFSPNPNSAADGSFKIQASTTNNSDTGLGGSPITASIVVNEGQKVANTPSVTGATTSQNTQTTSGLVITPNSADNDLTALFYKITGITGGTLFKSDGTTQITNGMFITKAEGAAGLKFTPATNSASNGSFVIQASTSTADAGLGGNPVTATVTLNAVAHTPSVTNAATTVGSQTKSGLVVTPNAADVDVTVLFYKVTGINGGTLFLADGTTQVSNGSFITKAQGTSGLKFTPNGTGNGSFTLQASTSNADAGLGGSTVTATITVRAAAHTPTVTNATTLKNTQTTSGLVITPNSQDGSLDLFFKITNITGGTLFRNNGTSQINNGDIITEAEAAAGLKFTPTQGSTANGSFTVQASVTSDDSGLSGSTVNATITVNNALQLNWTAPNSTEKVRILRRDQSQNNYVFVAEVAPGVTSFVDQIAASSTATFTYLFSRVTSKGYSQFATMPGINSSNGGGTATSPVVTNLQTSAVGQKDLSLTWQTSASNITGFDVYRSVGGGAYAKVTSVGASARSFQDAAPTTNTWYDYAVRAVFSDQTFFDNWLAGATNDPVAAPQQLAATSPANNEIDLSWVASTLATSYEIYRFNGSSYAMVGTANAGSTSYQDKTGLVPNTFYSYSVRAKLSSGYIESFVGGKTKA